MGLSGCDYYGGDPLTPIRVSVSWSEPVDLDLLIDEQPAHRQGGSPDQQSGGRESFEIKRGLGQFTVAVQNLSGHITAHPTITIDGVTDTEALTAASARAPISLQTEVAPTARKDCWVACIIDAERGTVERVGRWE